MPRVGSSKMQDARLGRQPLGQHDLLLVAAGQEAHLLLEAGGAQVDLRASSGDRSRAAGRRPRGRARGRAGRAGVVAHRRRQDQPSALRSSVTKPMPARIAWRGERMRTGLPSTSTVPASNGSTPKRACASSVRPEPGQPGDAERSRRRGLRGRCRAGAGRRRRGRAARTRRSRRARRAAGSSGRARARPSCAPARGGVRRGVSTVADRAAVLEDGDALRRARRSPSAGARCRARRARAPAAAATASNSASTSCGERAAVGSSMTRIARVEREGLGDLDRLLLRDRQSARPACPARSPRSTPSSASSARVSRPPSRGGRRAVRASARGRGRCSARRSVPAAG